MIFFIPFVLSSVAISFVWKSILSYAGVLTSICVVEIWRTLGFHMVLYIVAKGCRPFCSFCWRW